MFSRLANWFALAFPTGVPQEPQPFSSAQRKAILAFSVACFG